MLKSHKSILIHILLVESMSIFNISSMILIKIHIMYLFLIIYIEIIKFSYL